MLRVVVYLSCTTFVIFATKNFLIQICVKSTKKNIINIRGNSDNGSTVVWQTSSKGSIPFSSTNMRIFDTIVEIKNALIAIAYGDQILAIIPECKWLERLISKLQWGE